MRFHKSRYIGFLLPLFLCGLLRGQSARCSQDTVVGTYAFATQGTMFLSPSAGSPPVAVPAASLALLSIDSQGVMSGQAFGALGGNVGPVPGAGSFQVNPDCTATVKTAVGTTSTDVILDEGKEIRALMYQAPGAKAMVQGIGRRISRIPNTVDAAQCSPADVHGIYAVTYQGTYMMLQRDAPQPVPVPGSTIALVSIDYQGQLSGHGTISMAGDARESPTVGGNVDVKSDCSAVVQMSVRTGIMPDMGKSWMVVLEGGNELWAIQTESSVAKPIVTGTWKRISPIPSTAQ